MTRIKAGQVIADKGSDTNQVLSFVQRQGAIPVIPSRSSQKNQRKYDKGLYKERNLIKRASNRFKQWRRVATRYDRRSLYSLAVLLLAAVVTSRQ